MKLLFLLLFLPCCLKAQQRAYSPAGNYMESLDTSKFRVYYTGTDSFIYINTWVVNGINLPYSPFPLPEDHKLARMTSSHDTAFVITHKKDYTKRTPYPYQFCSLARDSAMLWDMRKFDSIYNRQLLKP